MPDQDRAAVDEQGVNAVLDHTHDPTVPADEPGHSGTARRDVGLYRRSGHTLSVGVGITQLTRADVRKTHVGAIAREILAAAAEYEARIIILGSTTKHDVPMLPFGSVSLRLLHHSDRPVLIVPRGTHAEGIPVAAASPAGAATAQ